jgi:Secretion system C-terminal sorting domain
LSQISITGSGVPNTYTQNFNTAAASLPSGWLFYETGSNANTAFTSGTGSSNIGNTYFLGTASEWCFGGLQSGTLNPTVGAYFTNNTGKTITDIYITYKGETWRVGTANRSDRLDFQYSTNATSLNTGTWTDVNNLDYTNPGQLTGSGSQQHTSTISNSIAGLNIQNGTDFYIRWQDFDAFGSDDAMGVDNFELYVKTDCDVVSLISATNLSLTNECTEGNWTYYGDMTSRYFGIKKNGNTFSSTISLTLGSTIPKTSSNGTNQEHAMFLMGRYWNVAVNSGSIATPVDVRFFYDPTELAAAKSARDASYVALPGGTLAVTNGNTAEWFKNTNGIPFDAGYISGIVGNKFPSIHMKFPSSTTGTLNGVTYVELTGIPSFSGGTGAYSYGPSISSIVNSLPVTWGSIFVKNIDNGFELNWQTYSEVMCKYFTVEYSYDGVKFHTLNDKIIGAGTSNIINEYSYKHTDKSDKIYYRIKQVDVENNSEYSRIVIGNKNEAKDYQFSITPTLIDGKILSVNSTTKITADIEVTIYDLLGRKLFSSNESIVSSYMNKDYDLSNLSNGRYIVKLSWGSQQMVTKIEKL